MRAMVTGCAGFIGSHLTESLLASGNEVLGVDALTDTYDTEIKRRNIGPSQDFDGFTFRCLDLVDADLGEVLGDVDVVFHLAGEPGVRGSWGHGFHRYLANNVLATQRLLEATRNYPDIRLVYASSSSIYGQAESFPTAETAQPNPYSPYGLSKFAGEQLCRTYHANFGLSTVALRLFSVYGPRQRPDMAFTRFCFAALEQAPIRVLGDGLQTRDFTFVEDVVAAMRSAAASDAAAGQAYNVGGGSRVALKDALVILEELAGRPLLIEHQPSEHGDVKDTGADTTLAEKELGFRPAVDIGAGLSRQFEWARQTARRSV